MVGSLELSSRLESTGIKNYPRDQLLGDNYPRRRGLSPFIDKTGWGYFLHVNALKVGSDVTTLVATDADLGFNARISYEIVDGNIDGKKSVVIK